PTELDSDNHTDDVGWEDEVEYVKETDRSRYEAVQSSSDRYFLNRSQASATWTKLYEDMAWNLSRLKHRPRATVPSWPKGSYRLVLIDTHNRRSVFTDLSSLKASHGGNLTSAIVARGYIPTSPFQPTFAVNVLTMEVFWALSSHGMAAFHGYAHARDCQIDFHPRIADIGLGLEDFEGFERLLPIELMGWSQDNDQIPSNEGHQESHRPLEPLKTIESRVTFTSILPSLTDYDSGRLILTNVKHAINVRDESEAVLDALAIRLRMTQGDIVKAHEAHCLFVRSGVSQHAAIVMKKRQENMNYLEHLEAFKSTVEEFDALQASSAPAGLQQRVTKMRSYNPDVQAQVKRQEAHVQGMKRFEEARRLPWWEQHSPQWSETERFRAERGYTQARASTRQAGKSGSGEDRVR
ncbi:MAG: hypothetical protein TREMPRED_006062, partial [Tremellales sp. Tagirdzhanova-0007]